ncbi:TadE/TadG family type IV pilus assembly protein [Streptomyces spiramenti]|uniref:Putative Flp pilus-assembly TadG-like N-terminal domain-containing protein n=1 Tax=Streptomyces spiramenti TaxID=2720606 RepID=A0ABX1AF97_9ACTN|nr:pilus assembly protein TadG-related protein [Streptomyces spiramenti]NJP64870.1 hypothetical protein [Streptomyces spiramenti]
MTAPGRPAPRRAAPAAPAAPADEPVPATGAGTAAPGQNCVPGEGDRGSAAILVVIFALTVITLAAFVVDGGLAISNRERAADIAEQAARYAAQDLDEEAIRAGATGAPINTANCSARVRDFVRHYDLTSAEVSSAHCVRARTDESQVVVQVLVDYRPLFSSVFTSSVRVTGEATAVAQAQ